MASATQAAAGSAVEGKSGASPIAQRYYRRFSPAERLGHVAMMLSFVGLALTGLPLLYSDKPWASTLSHLLGGLESARVIHRVCAFVMIVLFVGHVVVIFAKAIARGDLKRILWGPDSMVPQPVDILNIGQNLKWFVGLGPRPHFGRWTYWEKFDYWAVFWGMFIIGGSGLLLWFPVFFAKILPGWMFNIAALVHGEEALLAVGFIFTIHFFNGHLRPEKFPMDTVIFTGRIPEHELKEERPLEYASLVRDGRLAEKETTPPTAESTWFGWIVGGATLALGIIAIVLILYSVF